ncbi:MAG: hypothetical protein ACP5HG_12005, partial [Anaerolineae bacterium]
LGALALAATIQTHLTAVLLLLPVGVVGLVRLRRIKVGPLLIGMALFALSFLPFAVFQVRSGFSDLQVARQGIAGSPDVNLTALHLVLDLFRVGSPYEAALPDAVMAMGPVTRLQRLQPDVIAMGLLLGGFVYAVLCTAFCWRRERSKAVAALVLWLWFTIPILAFVPHTRLLFNYYFLYLLPVGTVLPALIVDRAYVGILGLARRWRDRGLGRVLQRVAPVIYVPLALVGVYQGTVDVLDQNYRATGAVGRQRIVDVQAGVETARALMDARPGCQFVVVADNPLWQATRFGLMNEFVGGDRVRMMDAGNAYLIPAPCAVYMLPLPHEEVRSWLETIAELLPSRTVCTPSETWRFYDLPHAARESAIAALQRDAPLGVWTNGLELLDFAIDGELAAHQEAATLTLAYTWMINEHLPEHLRADESSLRFANHLLQGTGTLVSQIDGVGFDSREWRVGDYARLVWRLPVPADLQPGEYALATALYSLPDVERVPLEDGRDHLVLRTVTLSE